MEWALHYEEVGLYAPDKMPFKSEKQRSFLHAKHPDIAKKWTKEHGTAIKRSAGDRLKTKVKVKKEKTRRKI